MKRACIIPAFLDYNMLVVNFKGMEEELFLCEGGGEIDWDMGSFMWDGEDGIMRCPNGKNFYLQYRKNVKGNKYGRQEEVYQCEDCSGCPYAEQCKKTDKNRTVRINRELTAMHQEVIENLESIQGALLRMNRSIQAEGTFGIMKNDRWYKRIVRRGIKSVLLEVFLVSIGHNLYKYHNKQKKVATAA